MEEETQKELVRLAKLAVKAISLGERDEDLLYSLRDILRKVDAESA